MIRHHPRGSPGQEVWNQHTYHITNVEEDGRIPSRETPNWRVAGFNNFRQNLPDFSPFAAPDLTVEWVRGDTSECPAALRVQARVCNRGDVRVGAGRAVRFYAGPLPGAAEIDCDPPVTTAGVMAPDRCEVVTCRWEGAPVRPDVGELTVCADDLGGCSGPGADNECDETNNSFFASDLACSPLG